MAARPTPEIRELRADGPEYPPGLRDLGDPPPLLYVRGRLPDGARTVAMVGSRAASPYGMACALRLARDLAGLGFAIASGLARGIDAAAHRGCLEAGGASIAVLPGGLDAVTPRHHLELAETLCERGALVSEWQGGAPRGPGAFVRRNRLIAALAAATIVVEAAEQSGALSTAAAARRLGRPLLAVPGDIDRPTARGVHALLRRGAQLCEGAADVIAALGGAPGAPPGAGGAVAGDDRGALAPGLRLLAALGAGPRSTESLAAAAGIGLEQALADLLRLEWAGAVRSLPGQRWIRA
jgi:DNA processing protein